MKKRLTRKQVSANVWKYYVYCAAFGLMLANTVFIVFMLARGLNYSQIGIAESLFAIAVMGELFGGAFADLVGRRIAVLLKCLIIAIASLWFGFSQNFWAFVVANVLWGIGLAVGAGADNALLYDSLKTVGREKEFIQVFSYGRVWALVTGMVGSFVGAQLYTVWQEGPFFLSAVFYAVAGLVYFSSNEIQIKSPYSVRAHYCQIKYGLKYALLNKNVRWIMLLSMLVTVYLAYFGVIQSPYLLDVGFSMSDVGWIVALAMAVEALVAYNTERMHQTFSEHTCFALLLLILSASAFGMATAIGVSSIAFLMLMKFGNGFGLTFAEHYLQKHSESKIRATVGAAEGFVIDGTMAVSLPLLGWMTDVFSIQSTLIIVGCMLFVFGATLLLTFPAHSHKVEW